MKIEDLNNRNKVDIKQMRWYILFIVQKSVAESPWEQPRYISTCKILMNYFIKFRKRIGFQIPQQTVIYVYIREKVLEACCNQLSPTNFVVRNYNDSHKELNNSIEIVRTSKAASAAQSIPINFYDHCNYDPVIFNRKLIICVDIKNCFSSNNLYW